MNGQRVEQPFHILAAKDALMEAAKHAGAAINLADTAAHIVAAGPEEMEEADALYTAALRRVAIAQGLSTYVLALRRWNT